MLSATELCIQARAQEQLRCSKFNCWLMSALDVATMQHNVGAYSVARSRCQSSALCTQTAWCRW